MIRLDMGQGTEEWHRARLGLPTASCFHKILTPTLKPAKFGKYLYELLAEVFVGEPQDRNSNEWMLRGSGMEEEAVRWYEFQRDVKTEEVGLCLRDDRSAGCSPDRLIGDEGGLEVKCPSAQVHIGWLLGDGAHKHRCQIQGSLWVTGRAWWDQLIYSPVLPPLLTRHEPDEEWLEAFEPVMQEFRGVLQNAKEGLIAKGLEVRA